MSTIASAVFSQNDPIYSLPHLYIAGMNISIASTTVLAVAPGQCRDSNDNIDMPISFPNLQGNTYPPSLFQNYMPPIFINSAINGAGGLDTGTIAASTQYAIYVIGDSRGYNQVSALISLTSSPGPTIPYGYDSYRLIGFIETDGASHFVYATHEPQSINSSLSYYLQPPISVLSGGDATTFTAVAVTTAVPSLGLPNVILYLLVTFIPAAVNDVAQFRPTGSSATTNVTTIVGLAAGVAQTQYLQIIAGINATPDPSFDYLVTSASDSLSVSVVGWTGAPHTVYPT
jgi:hypothetical protein